MSNLSIFNFQENPVRVEANNGEPLFCLKDVAEALGITNAKSSRFKLNKAGVHKMYVSHTSGKKLTTFINEPNLYRVIFRSNKDEAVKFQDWVFEEVLPAIRKTGKYELPQDDRLTDEQRGHIYQEVMFECHVLGRKYQSIFGGLKREFGVASYKHIKQADYPAACKFLGVEPKYSTPEAISAPEPKPEALPDYLADIRFDLRDNADYMVNVRSGKAQRVKLLRCSDPEDYKQPWWPQNAA